jgi:hypothetical protein
MLSRRQAYCRRPGNPSILKSNDDFSQSGGHCYIRATIRLFMLCGDVFKLKALPEIGSAVDQAKRGVGAFCQCVGFVPIGGGALGSRLRRWRCSLSFRADTSTSKSWQAVPSSPAWRHPRRPRPSKAQISIRRTRRAVFARSARPSISRRHHSCRMRRACRLHSRPEQSSTLAISISFLSRRNAQHFNRARRRWSDSRSLLI